MIYRFKQARKMKCESLRKAANGLGLSHAGLDKYEKGKIAVDSKTLIKFAKYYGVALDYLVPDINRPKVEFKNIEFHKIKKYV